jgi:hypothetical protein
VNSLVNSLSADRPEKAMQQEAHKQASDAKERKTGERKQTERWKKQPGLKPEPKTSEIC